MRKCRLAIWNQMYIVMYIQEYVNMIYETILLSKIKVTDALLSRVYHRTISVW